MVKHLQFHGAIDFASPEMVFNLLYEDDAFTKFYHKEVNKDENASATTWTNADGYRYREITFKPHFSNVPDILQGVLGGDLSPVIEIQECRSVDKTFIIHSKLQVTYWPLTLMSSGDTILSPLDNGCEIVVKLTLEVQTWFWQERLENYAESEAENTFKRWLKKARVFCKRMIGKEEEPPSEHGDLDSDANNLPEGNAVHFDGKQLESEDMLPTSQHYIEGPATSPSRRRTELGFLQFTWRHFCATIWRNYGNLMKSVFLMRQANFLLKAWITFGLGIATGITLGLLSSGKGTNN